MTFGHVRLADWMLDPSVTYLNHGTVGAVPRRVLAAQQAIRDRVERAPSQFMLRELASMVGAPIAAPGLLRQAAASVARFVGVEERELVFVDNVTTGINAVLRSLPLAPGDEIVLTDHSYGAVANATAFVARERRAVVRTVPIPYPAYDPDALVDRIAAALGDRTRLVLIDHIAAESALILPVAEIAARCRSRGVPVLVDGAHAPGVLPLDLDALGVDWYAANLHKWAHAPRSCGFLWAPPHRQVGLHPPVISWGLDAGFVQEFDWVGTKDPSAYLAAPEGIALLSELGDEARRYNHELAWNGGRLLTDRWQTSLEIQEAHIGSMITVPLPGRFEGTVEEAARLRDALLFDDRIEVQVHARNERLWIRVSAQIYNELSDVERLAEAVARR